MKISLGYRQQNLIYDFCKKIVAKRLCNKITKQRRNIEKAFKSFFCMVEYFTNISFIS